MSKKTKSSSTSNSTITPTNPAWVDNGLAGVGQQISNIGAMDPYSLVAGANPLQTSAGNTAGGLGAGTQDAVAGFNGGLDNASGILNGVAGASGATANPYMQNYMDPWLNDVVSTTLTGFDKNAGLQRAQAQLNLGGDTTFGGSGGSIYKSLLERDLTDQRASTEAGLRSQGFNTALGAANQDADRQQQQQGLQAQAAAQLAQIAQTRLSGAQSVDANSRANASSQADIGEILRQIQQQKLAAPLNLANFQAGAYGSLPLGLLHGTNSNGTSNSTTTTSGMDMSDMAKMAQAAAIAFSDVRLKQNIRTAGYDAKGRRWADYEYVWEPGVTHRGVIAQEILASDPHAVSQHESGYLMVNYGELR